MDIQRGDVIIDQLCAGELSSAGADAVANDLLNEIFRGYPPENLRRLIYCDEEQALKSGAWVISELGSKAEPLLPEIGYLLDSNVRNARFFAIDAALTSATRDDGAIIAKAIALIDDRHLAIRQKVLKFLARATDDQLGAAVPFLADRHVAELADWLAVRGGDSTYKAEIIGRLNDENSVDRRFAAAAAARLADKDQEGMQRAVESADPDIRTFAQRELAASRRWSAR